jgi:hypothetical protein
MKMEVGPIASRAIADKYKLRLGDLLAEHSFKFDQSSHMRFLIRLCEMTSAELDKNEVMN